MSVPKSEIRERQEFVLMLARSYPDKRNGEIMAFADAIMRLGRASSRYAVANCCREMSEAESKRDDRRDAKAEALCKAFGCGLNIGGDPRGYTFKVLVPEKNGHQRPYNTWGGAESGWGVPGS